MESSNSPARVTKSHNATCGPWDSTESGFPWAFFQVEVPLLLRHAGLPPDFGPRARRLLVNRPMTLDRGDAAFLKAIERLTDEQRRSCCWLNNAGVYKRDGHALFSNPWKLEETLFQDNPIGWIKNGLFCIDDSCLPLSDGNVGMNYARCTSLEFAPTTAIAESIGDAITPWIYTVDSDFRIAIRTVRAWHWLCEIKDGYKALGSELSRAWLAKAPTAPLPDPVYRFLNRPSVRLKREAENFMNLVIGETAICGAPTDCPPHFKHGPVVCSKRDLSLALTGKYRSSYVDTVFLSLKNPGGSIWQRPDANKNQHKHEYWFRDEKEYRRVMAKVDDC